MKSCLQVLVLALKSVGVYDFYRGCNLEFLVSSESACSSESHITAIFNISIEEESFLSGVFTSQMLVTVIQMIIKINT